MKKVKAHGAIPWALPCKRSEGRPVSRVLFRPSVKGQETAAVIYLAGRLLDRSSDLPEGHNGPDRSCPHIWSCSRWGLPSQPVTRLLVGSYIKG